MVCKVLEFYSAGKCIKCLICQITTSELYTRTRHTAASKICDCLFRPLFDFLKRILLRLDICQSIIKDIQVVFSSIQIVALKTESSKDVRQPIDCKMADDHPDGTTNSMASVAAGDGEGARVFLWCIPRTVSTALTKCLSFIDGMEVWFEPYVYCKLTTFEVKHATGQDIPMELDGNEEIFAKATELMRKMTGTNIQTDRIAYANVKKQLETRRGKHVFVKDMGFGVDKKTRSYLPWGYRHTFLIRSPERTVYSFRNTYLKHFRKRGILSESATKTFNLKRDCFHMSPGYYVRDVYDMWNYVRDEIDPNPIVIDTDDLLNNPRVMLRKYCELVGLPFSESLLQWDASMDICKTWKQCADDMIFKMANFYGRAVHSSSFMPNSDPLPREKMTSDVIDGIEETMKYYHEMYEHRITPL
ncbi:uncharacterized protein [Diadema setosum]|uniref:uncharacterized protein n=1 Tax=Diadema setosum TaxID=31175 RepID=UPI003B3BBD33